MQRGGREGAMYGRAILLGLGALEWEERAQHPTLWTCIVSQTVRHSRCRPAAAAAAAAAAAESQQRSECETELGGVGSFRLFIEQ